MTIKLFARCCILGTLLFIDCSNNPEIVFPANRETSLISGYVSPAGITATVYIIDATTIDSVTSDVKTGYFSFSDVPYGSYQLKVVADSFGVFSQAISVSTPFVNLYALRLRAWPSQINYILPESKSILTTSFAPLFTDTTAVIKIVFNERMDTASIISGLNASPPLPWKL